jgi:hypothetical protein
MKILDIGTDRFIVLCELGTDPEQAKAVQQRRGGILVRDQNTNVFILCEKIPEADFDEID